MSSSASSSTTSSPIQTRYNPPQPGSSSPTRSEAISPALETIEKVKTPPSSPLKEKDISKSSGSSSTSSVALEKLLNLKLEEVSVFQHVRDNYDIVSTNIGGNLETILKQAKAVLIAELHGLNAHKEANKTTVERLWKESSILAAEGRNISVQDALEMYSLDPAIVKRVEFWDNKEGILKEWFGVAGFIVSFIKILMLFADKELTDTQAKEQVQALCKEYEKKLPEAMVKGVESTLPILFVPGVPAPMRYQIVIILFKSLESNYLNLVKQMRPERLQSLSASIISLHEKEPGAQILLLAGHRDLIQQSPEGLRGLDEITKPLESLPYVILNPKTTSPSQTAQTIQNSFFPPEVKTLEQEKEYLKKLDFSALRLPTEIFNFFYNVFPRFFGIPINK